MHYLQDHRWRLLKEQRNDCSTYSGLDLGESKTTLDATGSQTSLAVWNIPLYNANGDASKTAYIFMRSFLRIYGCTFKSGEFASKDIRVLS
jgi:hypothetical protein